MIVFFSIVSVVYGVITTNPCSTGLYDKGNLCIRCPIGFYSTKSEVIFTPPSSYSCIPCTYGMYASNTGSSKCVFCDVGTAMPFLGFWYCPQCSVGLYASMTGMSTCYACSGGTFANTTGASGCNTCVDGTYSNASWTTCVSCSVGTYADISGLSTCKLCAAGTYNTRNGSSSCTACARGTYNAVNGSSTCISCVAETYAQAGSTACSMCTACANGQWATANCRPDMNTQCTPCTVCQNGYYSIGRCVSGNYLGQLSQDNICAICPTCKSGTYLSAGCVNSDPPVCSACSNCTGDVVLSCTSMSDTVCANVVSCRRNVNFTVYDWITATETCKTGQYLLGVSGGSPVCANCPAGLYGPNGLWCEACQGYKRAYLDGTACVCEIGTTQNSRGMCECREGMEFMDNGCVPCGFNLFSNYTLELGDDWYDQYKPCDACEAGKYSASGATACLACEYGTYREDWMDACMACDAGYFAMDPSTGNCTACNSTCDIGYDPMPCPTYAGNDLFMCMPCAEIPDNAHRTPADGFTSNTACDWECDVGYFRANETSCQACSVPQCPPGFNITTCSRLADANCDVVCVDKRKPLFNSKWLQGCQWSCVDGYSLYVNDYVLFVDYACVLDGTRFFWNWGR